MQEKLTIKNSLEIFKNLECFKNINVELLNCKPNFKHIFRNNC